MTYLPIVGAKYDRCADCQA